MSGKMKAFIQKWTSFFVHGRKQKECLRRSGGILRETELKGRVFAGARMRFCSVLSVNLSGMELDGGDFTGNGWYDCLFTGAGLSRVTTELGQLTRCSMGNLFVQDVCALELLARDCCFTGSRFERGRAKACRFIRCTFRGVSISHMELKDCVFEECVLDGVAADDVESRGLRFVRCRLRDCQGLVGEDSVFE